ncbi:heavy-metal-associated domain-containing protein [Paucibacter sp. APW11]|uniref:Heavy-metal-associated domain-containing protein n=1 Tax=Roseateles aquae TaxID=3077235 RepID=A0ABU3PDT3_9BURK|nr:heavy-metal-associated domain-containing protein [Paucibacter sp. APW11]MDT9000754.1 heavy-metal-associated domain-containing protein [Paucibacter sp. APW11]
MPTFSLPDMSCGHCVATITKTLQALDAQAQLQFDREARTLAVESALSREQLAAALSEAGYPPAD